MKYILYVLGIGFALFVALVLFLKKRGISMRIKGWQAQTRVNFAIGKTKRGKRYVINDLIIKTEDEGILRTSQIDHIVINERGIFVIETKNCSGRIYGKDGELEWTQALNNGKNIYRFYNPVMKNKTHLYFVSCVLPEELSDIALTSAVVFVKGNVKRIKAGGVYTLGGLRKLLRRGDKILTPEQMQALYDALVKVNGVSVKLCDREENLRRMRAYLELGKCPRCGRELALRTGRYGEFLACPDYPKCTFTKGI